jgi:broad specificity phosphatase PhoE
MEVWLLRHGSTEWTRTGQHTGRTDIALDDEGCRQAVRAGLRLAGRPFAQVLVSPLERARVTCELAGFGEVARVTPDLCEWDYGDYEGLTTPQIHAQRPDWVLWRDGCPGGEQVGDVSTRVDRVIAELAGAPGAAVVFSHGHLLRVLGARWIGLGGEQGARLALATGALCLLGEEHGVQILRRWNDVAEAASVPQPPA